MRKLIFLLSLAFLVVLPRPAAAGFTFTELDDPSAGTANGQGTLAEGISGSYVSGVYLDSSNIGHGFLYNGSTYTTLDDPAEGTGGSTYTIGISGNTVVGFYSLPDTSVFSFSYNITSGIYTPIAGPASAVVGGTEALGVSGNTIVGAYFDKSGVDHGFIYDSLTGVYTTVDDPSATPDRGTVLLGVAGDTAVGDFGDSTSVHFGYHNGFAYSISAGTYTTIDFPSAVDTNVFSLSGSTITGSYLDAAGVHGFLDDGGTFTTVDDPLALPAEGDIFLGGLAGVIGGTYLGGIDGNVVVGQYLDTTGDTHSFEVTVPEPTSLSLVLLAAPAVLARRRAAAIRTN